MLSYHAVLWFDAGKLLPEENLLWWAQDARLLDRISLCWVRIYVVVRLTPLLLTEVVIQPHKGGFCFLVTDSSCINNYFFLLFLFYLVSYTHMCTHIYKKPNFSKKITLEGDSPMVIFLLHLKRSALSCRSFLENPMSINIRERHPRFIKPSSSHALAMCTAVMAAAGLTIFLLTYLCFRCTLQGFFHCWEAKWFQKGLYHWGWGLTASGCSGWWTQTYSIMKCEIPYQITLCC